MSWRAVGFLPIGGHDFLKWNKISKYTCIIYVPKSMKKCFRLSTEAASENDTVGESVPINFEFCKVHSKWISALPYNFIRRDINSHNALSNLQPQPLAVKLSRCVKQLKPWQYKSGWKSSLVEHWVIQTLFRKHLKFPMMNLFWGS